MGFTPKSTGQESKAAVSPAPSQGAAVRSAAPTGRPLLDPIQHLRRATLLGHRPSVFAPTAGSGVIQRMLFRDRAGNFYDPETVPTRTLQDRLAEWQAELALPLASRTSQQSDEAIQQRIGQLDLQIEETTANANKPKKAEIDADFISKHILLSDQGNAADLAASIDKSILWQRDLNTVLHLSAMEQATLPYTAMAALKAANYPVDGRLVEFEVRVGRATEFREVSEEERGIRGNFGLYGPVTVKLGARWHAATQRGVLIHLEDISPWAPSISYSYIQTDTGRSLRLVYGGGPDRIVLPP